MRIGAIFWLIALTGLWAVAWFLTGAAGERNLVPRDQSALTVYVTVLGCGLVVLSGLRILADGGPRTRRYTVMWIATMICVSLGYGSRERLEEIYDRLRGNIHPSVALTTAQGTAELRRNWDGHYRAETQINGVDLMMLVDTGASMVLIPYESAHDLGIDREELDFSLPVTTANGQSHVARVRLSSIKIGPIAVFDVDAAVARPGMLKTGLLGMSFLERLNETSFSQGRLRLRN